MRISYQIIASFILPLLLAATIVPANAVQAQTTASSCTVLTHNLRMGATDYATGGDVSRLQAFLSQTGYFPYAPVGTFGPLTFRAAQQFQASQGLPATGYVGPLTRNAIQQISCGAGNIIPPSSTVAIQSLSSSFGKIGTSVTIYGSGFTQDNTIYFGATQVARIASNNGSTLSFNVPQTISAGTYTVTVQNSNGTSNQATFTVQSGYTQGQAPVITSITGPQQLSVNQVGTWSVQAVSQSPYAGQLTYSVNWGDGSNNPQYNQATYTTTSTGSFTHAYGVAGAHTATFTVTDQYGHSSNASASVSVTGTTQTQAPYVTSVSPASGVIGTTITISGSGFDASQTNAVLLNGNAAATISSPNGSTLSFTIPSQVWVYTPPQYCYTNGVCSDNGSMTAEPLAAGSYTLTVKSANGTSNGVTFTVTAPATTQVNIQSISASSGSVGSSITISGSGFLPDSLVYFGGVQLAPASVHYISSNTLSFQVPSQIGDQIVAGQSYSVYVQNSNGTSNSVSFTITASAPQNQSPVIQSLSPTSGPVGTAVTVQGSGFSSNNTVLFDNQAIAQQVYSPDGQTLSFTVPIAYISNCSTSECTNVIRNIADGVHTVTIANNSGTSNAGTFTLTSQVGVSQSAPAIQSLSPSSGPIGITVTVYGSGFTANSNSVLLSAAGSDINSAILHNETIASNVSSNGTSLSFTIPVSACSSLLTPTDTPYCYQVSLSVGSEYLISVANENGTSNALPFMVTASTGDRSTCTGQCLRQPK